VDASAAKRIVERRGLDKVRHIDVNVLWLQKQEIRGKVPLKKIDGTRNPADLMTKHLEAKKVEGHLERMGLEFRDGRAQAAANLYAVESRNHPSTEEPIRLDGNGQDKKTRARWEDMRDDEEGGYEEGGDDEEDARSKEGNRNNGTRGGAFREGAAAPDRWTCRGQGLTWIREHRTPRKSMSFPDDVTRGPSQVGELWNIRKTKGRMQDGRKFIVTDDWTGASEETETCIRQSWAGTTTSVMRTRASRLA
jgi:hypothetical protein